MSAHHKLLISHQSPSVDSPGNIAKTSSTTFGRFSWQHKKFNENTPHHIKYYATLTPSFPLLNDAALQSSSLKTQL